jgi:hypothetical protein
MSAALLANLLMAALPSPGGMEIVGSSILILPEQLLQGQFQVLYGCRSNITDYSLRLFLF